MPPYGQDLRVLIAQIGLPEYLVLEGRSMKIKSLVWNRDAKQEMQVLDPVVGGKRIDELEKSEGFVEQNIRCGIIAYVEKKEYFEYGPNKEKKAAKFFIEVEGYKKEFVYWPDKENNLPSLIRNIKSGSIIAMVVNSSSGRNDFSIRQLYLIRDSIGDKENEES